MTISPGSSRARILLAAAVPLALLATSAPMDHASAAVPTAAQRCRAMTAKVHESVNPRTRATLMTLSANEAAKARSNYGFTHSLGTPFRVSATAAPGLVNVYRLYNPRTHDFLWTSSASERSRAISRFGYRANGIDFHAAVSGGSCLKPVHRFRKGAMHRFAVTSGRQAALKRAGWRADGTAFFVATSGSVTVAPPKPAPVPKPPTRTSSPSSGPLSQPAYLWKGTLAWNAYQRAGDPATKSLLKQIAATPTSIWLGGNGTDAGQVRSVMADAEAKHQTPQFVLYGIPHRDCGNYSAGGVKTAQQYRNWVNGIRSAIGSGKAVVIVEPDAIGMSCLSAAQKAERNGMLQYAMKTMSTSNIWAYIHAGSAGLNPQWAADAIKKAGVGYGRGFAVNVSSFGTTQSEIAFGKKVIAALGMNKHFVIDTSRNGLGRAASNGGAPGWCNPPGRALGTRPTTRTASPAVDAYLWIKRPGESDGQCHAGDPRGWFQSYAVGLAQRALASGIIKRI